MILSKQYLLKGLFGASLFLSCAEAPLGSGSAGGAESLQATNGQASHSSSQPLIGEGKTLFGNFNCGSCHSIDKENRNGPPLGGLYGSLVQLQGGAAVTADDAYLQESILYPSAKRRTGNWGHMPTYPLTPPQVAALVAYIKSLL